VTTARYLAGCAGLAIAVIPLAIAASRARALLVPRWSGLPARLADITLCLGALLAVLHVLGAVGLFRPVPVVVVCAVVGSSGAIVLGRRASAVEPTPEPPPSPTSWLLAALVAIAVVAAQWAALVATSVRDGITELDSTWYHLPHAARFVQEGWITRLHFTVPEFPSMFHPADAELVHGFGMLLFGGDFLSLWINCLWAALAIAAAWGIGRPWGRGPISAVGVAILLATGEFASLQPGAGTNDISTVAVLLLVAAFLVQPDRSAGSLAIAGVAAGIAIGLKLTMLVPIGVLTLGILVLVARRRELRTAGAWVVPLVLAGSFWYLRNLFRAGSPVPTVSLGPLNAPHFAVIDEQGWSIAHYIGNGAAWRDYFRPSLDFALGSLWWAILGVAAAGLVLIVVRGSDVHRLLGITIAAGVVGYIIMPTSAMGPDGQPRLFFVTVRYAFGVLAVLLALLPTVRPFRERVGAHGLLAIYGVLFAVTVGWHRSRILASWDR